jgi:hypothetical protein
VQQEEAPYETGFSLRMMSGISMKPTALTEPEEELVKPLFDYFDSDRDGKLNARQVSSSALRDAWEEVCFLELD